MTTYVFDNGAEADAAEHFARLETRDTNYDQLPAGKQAKQAGQASKVGCNKAIAALHRCTF